MTYIIIPQAVKNILPALGNEFIVLIKETAVIGMIANIDLVGAARKVQSLTYDYVVPMLSIALIYYVVIKIVSTLLKAFENKLRKSDSTIEEGCRLIKVSGLKKSFGDLKVLKGIDQHVRKGEKIVLIGPSGSGKSTFLRCLNLLEKLQRKAKYLLRVKA